MLPITKNTPAYVFAPSHVQVVGVLSFGAMSRNRTIFFVRGADLVQVDRRAEWRRTASSTPVNRSLVHRIMKWKVVSVLGVRKSPDGASPSRIKSGPGKIRQFCRAAASEGVASQSATKSCRRTEPPECSTSSPIAPLARSGCKRDGVPHPTWCT